MDDLSMFSSLPSGQVLRQGKRARMPVQIHCNGLGGGRTRSATRAAAARVAALEVGRICEGKIKIAGNRTIDTYTSKPVVVTWITSYRGANYSAVVPIADEGTRTPCPAE